MISGFSRLLGIVVAVGLGFQILPAEAHLAEQLTANLAKMVGTLDVTVQPIMSEGKLSGCTFVV